MNNLVIQTIMDRRSVRSYKTKQINDEDLSTILKCGLQAPSARNQQAWELVAIQNKDFLSRLNADCVKFVKETMQQYTKITSQPNASIFYHAPTLVLVAGDSSNSYSPIDCSLVMQNIVLSACSLGLASCINGIVIAFLNSPTGQQYVNKMGIKEGYQFYISTTLGYQDKSFDSEIKERNQSKIIRLT